MRIVFMGTPDFAAASLGSLIDGGFDVAGVFTQPDKPRNRGMKTGFSPVKELALEAGIKVFQPEKLRDGTAMEILHALNPDLIAVVAYGRILPEEIVFFPPLGCINVHASLLPQYRGAAPVQWAVLNGDEITGVSTMYLLPELDSGNIIHTAETRIGEFETSGELLSRLRDMGARLLCKTVRDIEAGTAPSTPQDHSRATFAPQLAKGLSPIDWSRSPREIVKWICGLDPWPAATMELGGVVLRVFGAAYTECTTEKTPGQVVSSGKDGLEMACGGGKTLMITVVQAPGGKRMSAADYLRGHPAAVGD